MAIFSCLSQLITKKKKNKVDQASSKAFEYQNALRTLRYNFEQPVKPFECDELKSRSFAAPETLDDQKSSVYNVKIMSHDSPCRGEAVEAAYEGEDELEENSSIKRELSDLDLQARVTSSGEREFHFQITNMDSSERMEDGLKIPEKDGGNRVEMIQSGHVSDPGIGRAELWAPPMLMRSCSNLETRNVLKKIADRLPPSKSQSFEDMQELVRKDFDPGSPASAMTHYSADRVMLKKHSSSQVLPSRSRKLWWKLFLWSHRNLHRPWTVKQQSIPTSASLKQQGGYTSDTLELNQAVKPTKMESPCSFSGNSLNNDYQYISNDNTRWDGFHDGVSCLRSQNQWVAFVGQSSSLTRVDEWIRDLETQNALPVDDDTKSEEGISFPPSPDAVRSPGRTTTSHLTRHLDINLSEEILYANSVIQSLNSSSTVAHISGLGLKAIPTISQFCSLRSINLSNNLIVHITPGSLPKGLHTLNLSRNKISTIEGLRELSRLRVLDLSYNRISRIGQGLSNCTVIKELYLAGNKISDVEGLHRLLKLTVLDLSFNKITTTKALGQLVANYNSLLALNLLANPIQRNISDDQLRKAICSLLPKLVYLNKQPIKPQRAREVLTDGVAKAALGSSSRSFRRKAAKRVSQVGSVSSGVHRSSTGAGLKAKNKSVSRSRQHLPRVLSSAHASSSH